MTKYLPKVRIWFTDFWRPSTIENIQKLRLYQLITKYWDIDLSPDRPDFLIYSCFGFEYLKYNCLRIFYTGENVRPSFNHCDFAFSFDYPITPRNYRLPLYRLDTSYTQLFNAREPDRIIAERRKFCSFIASNQIAKERIHFFDLLSLYKSVDSGGKLKNNIGYRVTDKLSWLQGYKFNITFENSQFPGYTTEKILHAFVSNTIPIYWGNPLAAKDFNSKSFINCHDYETFEDVVEIVKAIDQNDTLYREYLAQPFFADGMEPDYLQEENIIARFDLIFSNKQEFIPRYIKEFQKTEFLISLTRRFQKRSIHYLFSLLKKITNR